ncbi:hypothetical protein GOFOIKOB_1058 [Methylobacterium tardum]|jgi:hypothetical protein|uniref:Lysozyme inhibitor LprI N-terminal domain-containing protein n=1 Tax=Methylobacterium tardum TaxID=374432 RepID=A0AA37TDS0_9HYPH|nr:hypothetical protein [Methylobacterium tardum]GJE48033.1 hypothetical protein GOFOIKOB_1058 [Methylobacterium tardum]GLS69323.1 hypothetical protein GCM10007890_13360 [Methylobacterium tardum]
MRSLLPAAALLGLAVTAAHADAVPSLDVERTCRSAQVTNTTISDQANYDGCLRSEREAKKEAEQHWGSYTAAAKRQCQDQFKAGGFPSYVEMVTCLELASGTVPTQSSEGGRAVGGPGSPRDVKAQQEGGANLTREPPASQRTNPIQVLENK